MISLVEYAAFAKIESETEGSDQYNYSLKEKGGEIINNIEIHLNGSKMKEEALCRLLEELNPPNIYRFIYVDGGHAKWHKWTL